MKTGPMVERPQASVKSAHVDAARAAVLAAFDGQPDGLDAGYVAMKARIPVDKVRGLMSRMAKSGLLEKTGLAGWWRRTDTGRDALAEHRLAEFLADPSRSRRPDRPAVERPAAPADLESALVRIAALEAALTPFVECALRVEPPIEQIHGDRFGDLDPLAPGEQKMSMITPPISALRVAVAAMPWVRIAAGPRS